MLIHSLPKETQHYILSPFYCYTIFLNKIVHMYTCIWYQTRHSRTNNNLNMHNMSPLWQLHDSGSKYGSHTQLSVWDMATVCLNTGRTAPAHWANETSDAILRYIGPLFLQCSHQLLPVFGFRLIRVVCGRALSCWNTVISGLVFRNGTITGSKTLSM